MFYIGLGKLDFWQGHKKSVLQFYKKLSCSYNSVICALFKTDVSQKYCQQFLSMLDADLS